MAKGQVHKYVRTMHLQVHMACGYEAEHDPDNLVRPGCTRNYSQLCLWMLFMFILAAPLPGEDPDGHFLSKINSFWPGFG